MGSFKTWDPEITINTVVAILNKNGIKSEKVHLQKFMFLFYERALEVPFSFSLRHNGPFSDELHEKLNFMVEQKHIGYDQGSYRCLKGAILLGRETYIELEADIKKFVNIVEDLSYKNMVLTSGLLWIMDRSTSWQNKDRVIYHFNGNIGCFYEDEEISDAYEKILNGYFKET